MSLQRALLLRRHQLIKWHLSDLLGENPIRSIRNADWNGFVLNTDGGTLNPEGGTAKPKESPIS